MGFVKHNLCYFTIVTVVVFACTTHAFDARHVDSVLTAAHACNSNNNPAVAVSVVRDGQVSRRNFNTLTRFNGYICYH
jgi:hypothetical protein